MPVEVIAEDRLLAREVAQRQLREAREAGLGVLQLQRGDKLGDEAAILFIEGDR